MKRLTGVDVGLSHLVEARLISLIRTYLTPILYVDGEGNTKRQIKILLVDANFVLPSAARIGDSV